MMAPKIVDKEQRKKEIAFTALNLFAEHGFDTTSISQIAKAAGIGKGTIYEYFETKEDLIFSAIMAWVDIMVQTTENMVEEVEDPVELLRRVVRTSMEVFINDERTIKLMIGMFQLLVTHGEFLNQRNIIREAFQGFRKVVIEIILDGISKGIFRPEVAKDVEKIAINLMAYLDGIGLHYFMSNDYFNLMEQVDFYLDELIIYMKPKTSL